jgi:hypothetical protein
MARICAAAACVAVAVVVHTLFFSQERFDPRYSQRANELLRIIEHSSLGLHERAEAAHEIGDLNEPAVVDRLVRLLPGSDDILTLQIIVAVGKLGTENAVPALEKVIQEDDIIYHSIIRRAARRAIDSCRQRKNTPDKELGLNFPTFGGHPDKSNKQIL